MGRQAEVLVKLDGHCQESLALLETDFLRLSAPHHVTVRFADITQCEAVNGWLTLQFGSRRADLHLGPKAEVWQKAILSPPTLLDKLGVKPNTTFTTHGFEDLTFLEGAATTDEGPFDIVLLNVKDNAGLKDIRAVRRFIAPKGALWIVYPRGSKTLPESLIRAEAISQEWVDTKTCRFDETRTALKFMRRTIKD